MKVRERNGSALLIVLGMLAFMVISAVAFSAYMRTSRLPSSYLRRVVASRMLAKAALSEAIKEIDSAIGSNPHPGVGNWGPSGGYWHNHWLGRVYIGGADGKIRAQENLVRQEDTVSTLTLEGLAYIPGPLVNDARYYSRHSSAAQWKSFDFDVGRYAFTAIDVSDYFDVNSVGALARDSSPLGKISLAYLFDTDANGQKLDGTASSWQSAMETYGQGSKLPLISVADMNLAMYRTGFGESLFCNYIINNGEDFLPSGITEDSPSADKYRKQTFVTDGWFPTPEFTGSEDDKIYDLTNGKYQPFPNGELKNSSPNFFQITDNSSLTAQRLIKYMPNVSLAMLYDYLDENRVPVSLSIPTTERVPMICGITPVMDGATLKVIEEKNAASGGNDVYEPAGWQNGTTRTATRTVVYRLDVNQFFGGMPMARVLLTYPFRHKDPENATFTVDGGMAFFLSSGDMSLRPRSAVNRLRFIDDTLFDNGSVADGVALVPFNRPSIAWNESVDDENAAVKEVQLTADPATTAGILADDNHVLLRVTYRWTQNDTTPAEAAMKWQSVDRPEPEAKDVVDAFCGFQPLTKEGAIDSAFAQNGSALVEAIENGGKEVKLNVAVYARVKYQNKTVDMVPACVENDKLNGSSNWDDPQSQIILQDNFGGATPLMRFDTGASLTFSLAGFQAAASGAAVTLAPQAVMVGDPRFNHAPESWFEYGGGVSASTWLNENGVKNGISGKVTDGDIFMQVSDQGYMQSIYELANILRMVNNEDLGLSGSHGDQTCGRSVSPETWSNSHPSFPQNIAESVNSHLMWRTYDPLGRYHDDGDGFEAMNFASSGGGIKINPFSDSKNVIMAALASTPHEWRVASTNEDYRSIANIPTDPQQYNSMGFSWSEDGNGAAIDQKDLEIVAEAFMERIRSQVDTLKSDIDGCQNENLDKYNLFRDYWEDMWRDIGWYCTGANAYEHLLGGSLSGNTDDIYYTDKKFLYGFWHDCFDVKQQLFLVFVRAEPAMMGGGAVGQTPPQLGARAVALVWRDPNLSRNEKYNSEVDSRPHRTRVLFYRQLD